MQTCVWVTTPCAERRNGTTARAPFQLSTPQNVSFLFILHKLTFSSLHPFETVWKVHKNSITNNLNQKYLLIRQEAALVNAILRNRESGSPEHAKLRAVARISQTRQGERAPRLCQCPWHGRNHFSSPPQQASKWTLLFNSERNHLLLLIVSDC